MLKFAGACLILASAAGIGRSFGMDLKKRLQELRALKQLACMLRGEIRYTKSPLPEAFFHIAGRLPAPFAGFLFAVAKELGKADGRSLGRIWEERIEKDLSASHLSRADKGQLETLGELLGYLDLEMQLSAIDLYLEQLELSIQEAGGSVGQKQRLYQSLGVAGGVFLVILLI